MTKIQIYSHNISCASTGVLWTEYLPYTSAYDVRAEILKNIEGHFYIMYITSRPNVTWYRTRTKTMYNKNINSSFAHLYEKSTLIHFFRKRREVSRYLEMRMENRTKKNARIVAVSLFQSSGYSSTSLNLISYLLSLFFN